MEVNDLLHAVGVPAADGLCELPGAFVNLPYPLPNGKTEKLLGDKKIYLGAQLEFADLGVCWGVVADATFILVCRYSVDGSESELVAYKKR